MKVKISDDIEHFYEIQGYNFYSNNVSRTSGGIIVYARDNHVVKTRPDLTILTDDVETLFLEIVHTNRYIIIGVIYRRPHSCLTSFTQITNILLHTLQQNNNPVFMMGDLNIDLLLNSTSNPISVIISAFHSQYYYCTITHPTRVTTTSTTLLDHIWTNCLHSLVSSGIVYTHLSDHFAVFSMFNLNVTNHSTQTKLKKTYRVHNQTNLDNFKLDLMNTDWKPFYDSNDPNECFDIFHTLLYTIYERNFPLKSKEIKPHHQNKPYITEEIKKLIKERNRLQRKYIKRPITYGDSYRNLRNRITQLIKNSKTNYFRSKIQEVSGD